MEKAADREKVAESGAQEEEGPKIQMWIRTKHERKTAVLGSEQTDGTRASKTCMQSPSPNKYMAANADRAYRRTEAEKDTRTVMGAGKRRAHAATLSSTQHIFGAPPECLVERKANQWTACAHLLEPSNFTSRMKSYPPQPRQKRVLAWAGLRFG